MNQLLLLSIILPVSALAIYFSYSQVGKNKSIETITINIKGEDFKMEIANTPHAREKGLMNRESLGRNEGMIFVFPIESINAFWMKNTLIPLDIIWLNSNKEVVHLKDSAKPCSNIVDAVCGTIIPTRMSKYVIELNGGRAKEIGLEMGDKIDFEL